MMAGRARIQNLPSKLDASPAVLELRIQTLCGMELEANDGIRVLDPSQRLTRRQNLEEIAGPAVEED